MSKLLAQHKTTFESNTGHHVNANWCRKRVRPRHVCINAVKGLHKITKSILSLNVGSSLLKVNLKIVNNELAVLF